MPAYTRDELSSVREKRLDFQRYVDELYPVVCRLPIRESVVQPLREFSRQEPRLDEELIAEASMVFLGNINQPLELLLKTSHLFAPLPEAMRSDMALIDRFMQGSAPKDLPAQLEELFLNPASFARLAALYAKDRDASNPRWPRIKRCSFASSKTSRRTRVPNP